jgi:fatty acid desaturase
MKLLRHSEDRRSLGLSFVHLAFVAGQVALFQAGAPLWLFFVTTPLVAASAFVQQICVHNAMHGPVFARRGLNRAWQCVLSICIGFPVSIYVPVHNLSHHLGLQTPRDVLRTTEVRHRSNLANLVHHMAMGTVHLHLLNVAYMAEMRRSKPRWLRQVILEFAIVIAYYVAIAIVVGPLAMLALVFLPAIAGQWLIVGFGYVQHDGVDHESEYLHSRNFVSPVFNWIICNNGFHTIHHNKPGMHWSLVAAAHRGDAKIDPRLDEPSLISYLWRAFVWPGARRRYDGAPVELPPARARRELWTPPSAIASGASSGAVDG